MSLNKSEDISIGSLNGLRKHVVEEIQIPVPWGHVSGKWWGPKDVQPIVAIHGWQDNAGSFDTLIPRIISTVDVAVMSIDLPGHGYSSHLPIGQCYYVFWDGVIVLRRILKYYQWEKVSYLTKLVFAFGKWWGPREIQPILGLHGRQDNAGTFDTLIPLLPNDVSVLCLDLPGHGSSSHYPKGHFYHPHWDGLVLLRRIIKHYKWNKVKLLGHSLGGAISFLYAASFPDKVDFLISLDIASPNARNVLKTVSMTADHIDKFLKYECLSNEEMPCYEYNDMIDVVEKAYQGSITREGAEMLMKRGMQPALKSGHYYFSRDPRLKVSLLGMLSMDLIMGYASKITCGYLNIRAVPGMVFDEPENYLKVVEEIKKNSRKFEYHEVEGTHHVHLINPERVAPIIQNFISEFH